MNAIHSLSTERAPTTTHTHESVLLNVKLLTAFAFQSSRPYLFMDVTLRFDASVTWQWPAGEPLFPCFPAPTVAGCSLDVPRLSSPGRAMIATVDVCILCNADVRLEAWQAEEAEDKLAKPHTNMEEHLDQLGWVFESIFIVSMMITSAGWGGRYLH